jgi:hypothetical protein
MIRVTAKFYVCNYADYQSLPSVLYTGHTGQETQSIDDSKFIVCGVDRNDPNLSWMTGTEPEHDHLGILAVLDGVDWNSEI